MKSRVLIIEDNYCKYFVTKQLIESQCRIAVNVCTAETPAEILQEANSLDPNLIVYQPNGNSLDLLQLMKKRGANRRNTEVTIILASEFDEMTQNQVENLAASYRKLRKAGFAAAA